MLIGLNSSSQGFNVSGDWNEAVGTNDIAERVVRLGREQGLDIRSYWGGNCKTGSSNIAGLKGAINRALNDRIDLFLSFHTDSAGNKNNDGRGYTGSLMLYKTAADKKFGETVVAKACSVANVPFYASRKRTDLLVLNKTTGIPSCLIEIMNHSDPDDLRLLLNENWREVYARGLVEGIKAYLAGEHIVPQPMPQPVPQPSGPRLLKKGVKGQDVKDLQNWLNSKGFSCGNADGIFGNKTNSAVRAFQSAAGLSVDGIVGPRTRAAMTNWKVSPPTPEPAPQPAPAPQPTNRPQLKQGSRGQEVRELQSILRTKGYPLAVDGIFGPQTKRAVVRFQATHGLAADGIVGPKTYAKLYA